MDVDAAKALAIRMNMEIEASAVMTAPVIDMHYLFLQLSSRQRTSVHGAPED